MKDSFISPSVLFVGVDSSAEILLLGSVAAPTTISMPLYTLDLEYGHVRVLFALRFTVTIGKRVLEHFCCPLLLRTLRLRKKFHQATLLQEEVRRGPYPQTVSIFANSTDFYFIDLNCAYVLSLHGQYRKVRGSTTSY